MSRTLQIIGLLCVLLPNTGTAQVTILQINDIYRIDAVDNGTMGGLGRVSTLIDSARRRGEKVLLLHGGDFISPSFESEFWGGLQMIDAMNYLHRKAPLIVVPGNHEYDADADTILARALIGSRFPWLAGNLQLKTSDVAANAMVQRDTVLDIGGIKIGIFALTLIDDAQPYAIVDSAVMQIAERNITSLEQRGAQIIIGLTHLEFYQDAAMAKLRRTHPKFQWIVSGHEHYAFSYPMTDSTALVTNGESNARRIWRTTIAPSATGPRLATEMVVLDSTVAVDPAYQKQIVQRYAAALAEIIPMVHATIGRATVMLDGREETVRETESNWGNYLTDLMRKAFPDVPADIAFLNGGSIRIDDMFTDTIRWEHLARTFPYPGKVALVWLRGSDVRSRIIEHSVSGDLGNGRFAQFSGVRFSFDRRKPSGQRVVSVDVNKGGTWQPLDDNAHYIVAVPEYSYNNGDGYDFRRKALMTVPPGPDLQLMAFDDLIGLYAQGRAIAPVVQGRIVEIK